MRWLLVFDNVDDAQLITPFWPATDRGSILLTARKTTASSTPSQHQLRLEPLSIEDSSKMILEQLKTSGHNAMTGDAALALELSKELGGLPLAITQIVGFMCNTECNLSDICQIFRDRQHPEIFMGDSEEQVDCYYEYTLSNVWAVTLSRFDESTSHFLDVVGFLDPDNIPEQVLDMKDGSRLDVEQFSFLHSKAR